MDRVCRSTLLSLFILGAIVSNASGIYIRHDAEAFPFPPRVDEVLLQLGAPNHPTAIGTAFAYEEELWRSVMMLTKGGSAICSAVLIDDEWALTAAHCVSFGVNDFANTLEILELVPSLLTPESTLQEDLKPTQIEAVYLMPGWRRDVRTDHEIRGDIALLRLASDMGSQASPVPWGGQALPGNSVVIAGYGFWGDGLGYEQTSNAVRMLLAAATNTVEQDDYLEARTGPRERRTISQEFIGMSFSGPRESQTALEGVGSPGDSGGAVLVDHPAGYELVGINSWGAGPSLTDDRHSGYGDPFAATRLSRYCSTIQAIIQQQHEVVRYQRVGLASFLARRLESVQDLVAAQSGTWIILGSTTTYKHVVAWNTDVDSNEDYLPERDLGFGHLLGGDNNSAVMYGTIKGAVPHPRSFFRITFSDQRPVVSPMTGVGPSDTGLFYSQQRLLTYRAGSSGGTELVFYRIDDDDQAIELHAEHLGSGQVPRDAVWLSNDMLALFRSFDPDTQLPASIDLYRFPTGTASSVVFMNRIDIQAYSPQTPVNPGNPPMTGDANTLVVPVPFAESNGLLVLELDTDASVTRHALHEFEFPVTVTDAHLREDYLTISTASRAMIPFVIEEDLTPREIPRMTQLGDISTESIWSFAMVGDYTAPHVARLHFPPAPADANADRITNVADFIVVLLNFATDTSSLSSPQEQARLGDVNTDGVVNVADFIDVLLNFGSRYTLMGRKL